MSGQAPAPLPNLGLLLDASTSTDSPSFLPHVGLLGGTSEATVQPFGSLSAVEGYTDSAAAQGAGEQPISGGGTFPNYAAIEATDAGGDVASLSGDVGISGTIAATEAGDFAYVRGPGVVSQGYILATGGSDTASISGIAPRQGTIGATESPDTFSSAGESGIVGQFDVTEHYFGDRLEDYAYIVGTVTGEGVQVVESGSGGIDPEEADYLFTDWQRVKRKEKVEAIRDAVADVKQSAPRVDTELTRRIESLQSQLDALIYEAEQAAEMELSRRREIQARNMRVIQNFLSRV